jgi:hypothetical protein
MSWNRRNEEFADLILNEEIEPLYVFRCDETAFTQDREFDEKLAAMGIEKRESRMMIDAIRRATEDDEEEVQIYFRNDSDPMDKARWQCIVAIPEHDGTLFVGIDPKTLYDTRTLHKLCLHIVKNIKAARPHGKPFGHLVSEN